MTAPPPKRPWRKRKRTIALAVLLLALSYPASFVPAVWALMRLDLMAAPFGYVLIREVHRPTAAALKLCPKPVQDAIGRVIDWGAPEDSSVRIDPTMIGLTTDVPDDDPTDSTIQISTLVLW